MFSLNNLARLWPDIVQVMTAPTVPTGWSPLGNYNPVDGAFDTNWLPDGSVPPNLANANGVVTTQYANAHPNT
jgi:hypothetical protein